MADNRPKGYGLTREISDRINSKYSLEDEVKLVNWIAAVLAIDKPNIEGSEEFKKWLEDGLVLCELMNAIVPGSCKAQDPYAATFASMQNSKMNENVAKFLNAASELGVKKLDTFQTVDLRNGTNLAQVQTALFKLSSVATTQGYDGPSIGVKVAEKNARDIDEAKLREGRSVIGLQMGTNQVASQQGMTPYGLGRQVAQQK